jgi:hypothetical protein
MGNFQLPPDYVDVAQRIRDLAAKHPDASLQPLNPDRPYEIVEIVGTTWIVYVAACYRTPDDPRPGVGVAWEEFPGRTPYTKGSELQNAETSAWGRAIVAALASTTKHVASVDEIGSARARQSKPVIAASNQTLIAEATAAAKDAKCEDWVKEQKFVWPWTEHTCRQIIDHADELMQEAF